MLNVQKIEGMIRNLNNSVAELRQLAPTGQEAFLQDSTKIGAAKYYLQISIEACIDIGSHIIAAENYRKPTDYRDIFTVLKENDVLPGEFAQTLHQMAGLRNRLVHLYAEINDDQIHAILQSRLGDFEAYVQHILDFVKRQSTGG